MRIITIDRATLAAELLDVAKANSRVEHTRDDDLISSMIAQAIDDIQRLANVYLFDTEAEWTGAELARRCRYSPDTGFAYPVGMRVALPFNNVQSVEATDAEGTDVSASFSIEQGEPGGNSQAYLIGPNVYAGPWPGLLFLFRYGVESETELAPSVKAAILRRTSAYYENREANLTLALNEAPGEFLSIWRPAT